MVGMGASQGFTQSSLFPHLPLAGVGASLASLGLDHLSPVSVHVQVGSSPFLLITPGNLASRPWPAEIQGDLE